MRCLVVILVVLMPLCCGAAGERPDLRDSGKDWHVFPRDIQSVHIAPDGRAWFVSDRFVEWAQAKAQVESAGRLERPWVQGVDLLAIDASGRMWLTDLDDPKRLRAWDPKTKTWLEHPGKQAFRAPVFESANGRVYVADLAGVHVLEDGEWSYQALHGKNFESGRFYSREQAFNPPVIVQDGAGRVYLHARWGRYGWTGTMGYWVHSDEAGWQQIEQQGTRRFERLLGIMPIGGRGSQFLVCAESQDAFWVDLFPPVPDAAFLAQVERLGARTFAEREKATNYLKRNGRLHHTYLIQAHAQAEEPEVRMRLHSVLVNCGLEQVDGLSLRHVSPLSPVGDGGWWFHADQTKAAGGKIDEHGGIFHISASGSLTKVSDPVGYPDAVCVGTAGELYLGTRTGGLLRGKVAGQGEKRALGMEELELPLYWSARELLGVDRDGCLYMRGRRGLAALRVARPER